MGTIDLEGPFRNPERYVRRILLDILSKTDPTRLSLVFLQGHEEGEPPPPEDMELRSSLRYLLNECVAGRRPELGANSGLALTPSMPKDDPRWMLYLLAREMDTQTLGPDTSDYLAAAIQVVWSGAKLEFQVRRNHQIRGVLWAATLPGDKLTMGWELPPGERGSDSHVTVLNVQAAGKPGALVYWNPMPWRICTLPAGVLLKELEHSIQVPGARMRWKKVANSIDPEEARGFYWEAELLGIFPRDAAYYILDQLDDRHPKKAIQESTLESDELDKGQSLFGADGKEASGIEDFKEVDDRLDDTDLVSKFYAIADQDERILLDALLDGWQKDPNASLTQIARDRGLKPSDMEAVRKRLARKVKKSLEDSLPPPKIS